MYTIYMRNIVLKTNAYEFNLLVSLMPTYPITWITDQLYTSNRI